MSWTSRIPAPRSFGGKMMVVIVIAAAVAVTLACVAFVPIHYYRSQMLAHEDVATLSEVIAIHSTAAMDFADPATAAETLAALRADPDVAAAALFWPSGELFASYRRAQGDAPKLQPQELERREKEPWMFHRKLVTREDRSLGVLVLAYDTRAITAQLWRDTGLAVLAAIGSILVAGLLAYRLQRLLAEPVAELSRAATAVAENNDYTVRAHRFSDDELGRLTDTFNGMLDRIDQQNREIQHSNAELQASNQEMEQFVYTVSHDLKSPLVTITGFVGLLQEDLKTGHTQSVLEAAEHLKKASAKMGELIDDLLQLSRIGRVAIEHKEVDVNEVLDELKLDLQGRLAAAGAVLEVQPNLPCAWSEHLRLTQVFDNLLTNAIKYGCTAPGCRIVVGGERRDGETRYFVRDHGPGIAPEYHDRVFGLFQRLSTHSEGTGIGLAIVARIIEMHGGRVWIESAPGCGATFWFSIPASPRARARTLASSGDAAGSTRKD